MEIAEEATLWRVITAGVGDAFNKYGAAHGLPPMLWELSNEADNDIEGRHPDSRSHPEARALCERWATLLGLDAPWPYEEAEGFQSWRGSIHRWDVTVHCVTDPVLYCRTYPDDPV